MLIFASVVIWQCCLNVFYCKIQKTAQHWHWTILCVSLCLKFCLLMNTHAYKCRNLRLSWSDVRGWMEKLDKQESLMNRNQFFTDLVIVITQTTSIVSWNRLKSISINNVFFFRFLRNTFKTAVINQSWRGYSHFVFIFFFVCVKTPRMSVDCRRRRNRREYWDTEGTNGAVT